MPDKLTITHNGFEPCQRGPRVRRDLVQATQNFDRSTGIGVMLLIGIAIGIAVAGWIFYR